MQHTINMPPRRVTTKVRLPHSARYLLCISHVQREETWNFIVQYLFHHFLSPLFRRKKENFAFSPSLISSSRSTNWELGVIWRTFSLLRISFSLSELCYKKKTHATVTTYQSCWNQQPHSESKQRGERKKTSNKTWNERVRWNANKKRKSRIKKRRKIGEKAEIIFPWD